MPLPSLTVCLLAAVAVCYGGRIIEIGGRRKASPHIIGGDDAKTNQFPELVSVQHNKAHLCGGTLIDASWVLTAAHCVNGVDPALLSVVAGTLTWAQGGVRAEVEWYQVHDEYNPVDYFTHDVALIKLSEPLELSDYIQLATLRQEPVKDGDAAVVAGWGMTQTEVKVPSQTLKYADVTVMGNSQCQAAFSTYATVYQNQICIALEVGKGECKGDSGGPLFVDGMQVGIVSWSPKPCAASGYPGVFASVAEHLAWIRTNSVPYL